jgi:MFS family permease
MTAILRPVTALLFATAILMLGGGLQGVLLPIRAKIAGFSDVMVGIMGAGYYAGLLAGCLLAPSIIGRVGHIRAFTVFTALACTTPLLHAIWVTPPTWIGLRMINGVCFAGLLLVIESWLSSASDAESRGRVLGVYAFVHLVVVTVGMQFLNLAPPSGFELFSMMAILYALAALPVALTRTIAPVPPSRPRLRLRWLYRVSPAAVGAAALTGITNGAYWNLTPIYAQGSGFDFADIALFSAVGVLGGALTQWPAGSLSDRYGRRGFLAGCAATAAAAGLGLTFFSDSGKLLLFVWIAIFGAANFPVYTLALAHANDLVPKQRAIEVSGGLLLVFSLGAVAGPVLGSLAMTAFGYPAVFLMTAIGHLLIVAIVIVRARARPVLSDRHHEDFVLVPRSTPVVYELDPRAEPTADIYPPTDRTEDPARPEPARSVGG